MSTEIDELKQARYRSDKTISGHNAFLRPPTGETNSVDTRGFYFVLKEPHPNVFHNYWLQTQRKKKEPKKKEKREACGNWRHYGKKQTLRCFFPQRLG